MTIDPLYVKTLEDENQSLREKLAKTEEELDRLNTPPSATDQNQLFTIGKNQNISNGWMITPSSFSSSSFDSTTISNTFSISGVTTLDAEKADFVAKLHDTYIIFKKATLWTKLKMLFSIIKTSKKE